MRTGTPIEHFPELVNPKLLNKDYFFNIVTSGISRFDFRNIVYKLPSDAIDVLMEGSRRWYICTRGILCYACSLYGYVRKTKITYYSKSVPPSENNLGAKLYFLPWDKIKQYKEPRIWFLNRRTKPSMKQAYKWFIADRLKAKRLYDNPLYSPMDYREEVKYNQCKDGIFVDSSGIIWIIKVNQSHHYFFVQWLSISTHNILIKR